MENKFYIIQKDKEQFSIVQQSNTDFNSMLYRIQQVNAPKRQIFFLQPRSSSDTKLVFYCCHKPSGLKQHHLFAHHSVCQKSSQAQVCSGSHRTEIKVLARLHFSLETLEKIPFPSPLKLLAKLSSFKLYNFWLSTEGWFLLQETIYIIWLVAPFYPSSKPASVC